MPTRSRHTANMLFAALLIAYAIYGAAFIWNTSTEIDGERTFVLFDDAMISMRYAKNFAAGEGLVWNAGGERVEGYTNPLWVVYMALFHWLRIDQRVLSLCIQISALIFLMVNLVFVRRIADLLNEDLPLVGVLAAFFTAFYLPLNTWGLLGMEVSILTLILSVVVWLLLRGMREQKFSILPYVLLGIGTLIRFDVVVPLLVIILFMLLLDGQYRRRHLTIGLAISLVFLGGQTLFRLAYYGDLLPNTYYLKVEGYPVLLRIAYGLLSYLTFIGVMNWLIFLLPFSTILFRRDRMVLLLVAIFAGQSAYSIYVGGDAWDWWQGANRFISIAMPLFFVLLASAFAYFYAALRQRSQSVGGGNRRLINFATIGVIVLMTINMNAVDGGKALAEWTLQKTALHVQDAHDWLHIARYLEQATTASAKIAVVQAGTLPYFMDRQFIDLLGKSDRFIAHQPMHTEFGWYAGHLKWDYTYSIGQLQPDVVVDLWLGKIILPPELLNYEVVELLDHTIYFRTGSPHIHWDAVEPR